MNPPTKEPRKIPNRVKFSATLNPLTAEKLARWAEEDCKPPSHVVDDVVAFAADNGFRKKSTA